MASRISTSVTDPHGLTSAGDSCPVQSSMNRCTGCIPSGAPSPAAMSAVSSPPSCRRNTSRSRSTSSSSIPSVPNRRMSSWNGLPFGTVAEPDTTPVAPLAKRTHAAS